MYKQATYLTGRKGNNAFSYDKRGPNPKLFIPAVVEGNIDDVQEGDEVVFADCDENGLLQECKGLKYFLKTRFDQVPVVIVDNHNHVFYFWYEALQEKLFQRGAVLVHVDQHKDARVPEVLFTGGDLPEVFRYTNEVLNVGNYIVPAQREGLIGDVQFVTSEMALEDEAYMNQTNKILNIDLDFFAPELDYIHFEKAKNFVLKHAKNAALITIATSPFFIEQTRAIHFLKALLQSKKEP